MLGCQWHEPLMVAKLEGLVPLRVGLSMPHAHVIAPTRALS